ncbi:MAG: isoprenylcysteine carboxylmethyltransferase family protein [Patescibacteria group bacterium]|nr:isoprenylcysteine carboxylmethyltransferase family protein [Patescibacteria group bacterium]
MSTKLMISQKIISIPPTYFYVCIIFNSLLVFWPLNPIFFYPANLFGAPLVLLGLYLVLAPYYQFKRNNTPENFGKSTCTVTDGLYKYSRNPMYLGAIVLLIGFALLVGDLWGFLSPVLLFLVLNFMFIPYEEEKMRREQGESYLRYRTRVRRWI